MTPNTVLLSVIAAALLCLCGIGLYFIERDRSSLQVARAFLQVFGTNSEPSIEADTPTGWGMWGSPAEWAQTRAGLDEALKRHQAGAQ